ncbi:MAG: capsular biosynthesis protein [Flavobacteriales bacterium]|nr:capsular biosynthesis protein [Flavobacteriales bacterium]
MRICIDLDGVIAQLKDTGESYAEVRPVEGAIEKIRALKENGHYIIIYTARHMKTCEGNVGKVVMKQGKVTLEWLEKQGVPYDEIYFGKPWADVYIDDNAVRFNTWDDIRADGSSLPASRENQKNG